MSTKTESSSRLQLYLLLGIPVFIILTATLVFYTGIGAPSGTKNKGVLVQPVRALSDYGISFSVETPLHKPVWTLLELAPDGCDQGCEETLLYSRQIRTSLGRRTPGLRRLLWVDDIAAAEARLAEEHADLEYQQYPGDAAAQNLFAGLATASPVQFYLIDPQGYLMMYYTSEQNYKEIIRDLKFLLTQSGY